MHQRTYYLERAIKVKKEHFTCESTYFSIPLLHSEEFLYCKAEKHPRELNRPRDALKGSNRLYWNRTQVTTKLFEAYRIAFQTYLYTVWKFYNFTITQILRELNFGWFEKVKNCHSNHLEALNFDFWEISHFEMSKIQNSELLIWSKCHFFELQNDQN